MRRFGTIFVTALLVGIFFFFFAKIQSAPVGTDGRVRSAGDKVLLDPKTGQPVVVAEEPGKASGHRVLLPVHHRPATSCQ